MALQDATGGRRKTDTRIPSRILGVPGDMNRLIEITGQRISVEDPRLDVLITIRMSLILGDASIEPKFSLLSDCEETFTARIRF